MDGLFKVSSNPHIRSKDTTSKIMLYVVIALMPACAFGVYNFGLHALLTIVLTVLSTVLTEYIYEKCMKKKVTIGDLSAVVTGLLLAMNLPPKAPLWLGVVGGIFAILVVKMLFGGLGQNFMNPALGARCFLVLSFGVRMTTFVYDGVTGATPLAVLKTTGEVDSVKEMFIGNIGGTIGETSVIALLIGAAYLLVKKVIDFRIPFFYIASFSAFVVLFGDKTFDFGYLLAHLCGGGLILGAFFMATDYVTSPITPVGRIVYGVMLGILTAIFRIFGPSAEGVSFAIIFGNLLVPLIDKLTRPRPFGYVNMKKKEGK